MDSREAGKAAGAPDSGGITGITETGIIVTSSTLSACTKGKAVKFFTSRSLYYTKLK
jgi:hypothetical protein